MTEFVITDLRTGSRLHRIRVARGDWDDRLGEAESINATINLRNKAARRLDLPSLTSPGKACLAVVEGDEVMAHGPIWARRYDRDRGTLQLGAAGMQSYFDHRLILPVIARTYEVTKWVMPDPADATKTVSNPALNSSWVGLWLGTIMQRAIQQAIAWTGGNIPIVLPDEEVDMRPDNERNIKGTDFRVVGDFLRDTSQVIGGPEYNFQGRLRPDRMGIESVFQVGTKADRLIRSATVHRWDLTAPRSPVSNFQVSEDATKLAGLSWQTGGRDADKVMVARSEDTTLTDHGYPLYEALDSSHMDVSVQSTLDGYANAGLRSAPMETWSFDVNTAKSPRAGEFSVGDFADVVIAKLDVEKKIGDYWYPRGGTFRRRIIGLSGDERGKKMRVDFAPAEVAS